MLDSFAGFVSLVGDIKSTVSRTVLGGLSIIGSVLFSGSGGVLDCTLERFCINSIRLAVVSGVVFVRGELDGSTIRFPPPRPDLRQREEYCLGPFARVGVVPCGFLISDTWCLWSPKPAGKT